MCADAGIASSRFSVTQLRIKLCWSQQNAAEQQDQLQLCVLSLWAPCVHSPFLTQFVSYNVTVLLYQNHDAASPVWPDLKKTISPVADWHCFARCIVHSDFNTEHGEISPSFLEWWTRGGVHFPALSVIYWRTLWFRNQLFLPCVSSSPTRIQKLCGENGNSCTADQARDSCVKGATRGSTCSASAELWCWGLQLVEPKPQHWDWWRTTMWSSSAPAALIVLSQVKLSHRPNRRML